MKAMLLSASAGVMATVLLAGPAYAQDADAGASDNNYGEIVVTAQRRAELSRDVPISLTALGAEQLSNAGISTTRELAVVTPGLLFDRVGNFTLPALRGVTTTITGPGTDTNVAIYLDGLYQPSSVANTFDLPDVERVEVIKGPQGTLFGRNATGGAIKIETKTPGDEVEGNFTLGYGRFNDLSFKGFIAAPLVEGKAAFSVATMYRKSDSYYRSAVDGKRPKGEDSALIRAKLRLTPSENLSIDLTALYANRKDSLGLLGSVLGGNTIGTVFDTPENTVTATRKWTHSLDADQDDFQQITKTTTLSAKIALDIGVGTITSLTGYSKFINVGVLDADYSTTKNGVGLYFDAGSKDVAKTEELTFTSALDGPFNFTLGAFYFDGWGGWWPLGLRTPGGNFDIWSKQKAKSWAVFGEGYLDISDQLTAVVGARYTHEKRSDSSTIVLPPSTSNSPRNFIGSKSWNSFVPRFSLRYKLTPTTNVYATFSKGFKSGTYDSVALAPLQADGSEPLANPEKLTSYEVGFKGRVAPFLNLTAAAFYYDYKNLQVTYFKRLPGSEISLGVLGNVKGAKVKGLEFDANFNAGPIFDGRAGISYLHGRYGSDFTPSISVPNTTNGVINLTGNHAEIYDASHKAMIKAPAFTLYLTGTFHFDVAGGTLDVGGTVFHSSKVHYTYDHRVTQGAYETYDARVAWSPESNDWTLSVYGRNLSNKAYYSGTWITDNSDGVSWAPPRTYGVQLDVRF